MRESGQVQVCTVQLIGFSEAFGFHLVLVLISVFLKNQFLYFSLKRASLLKAIIAFNLLVFKFFMFPSVNAYLEAYFLSPFQHIGLISFYHGPTVVSLHTNSQIGPFLPFFLKTCSSSFFKDRVKIRPVMKQAWPGQN